MLDPIAIATIAAATVSTLLSAFTFWFVFLHRGRVRMTRPTLVFFGRDGDETGRSKIFLRSSIFSTSKRGQIVENMYAKVDTPAGSHLFSFWAHRTDESSRIVRGSGLAATENGIACDHHFLLPTCAEEFEFVPGGCTITVFAKLVDRACSVKLGSYVIELTEDHCLALRDRDVGIYFDLQPSVSGDGSYEPHVERRSSSQSHVALPGEQFPNLPFLYTAAPPKRN